MHNRIKILTRVYLNFWWIVFITIFNTLRNKRLLSFNHTFFPNDHIIHVEGLNSNATSHHTSSSLIFLSLPSPWPVSKCFLPGFHYIPGSFRVLGVIGSILLPHTHMTVFDRQPKGIPHVEMQGSFLLVLLPPDRSIALRNVLHHCLPCVHSIFRNHR